MRSNYISNLQGKERRDIKRNMIQGLRLFGLGFRTNQLGSDLTGRKTVNWIAISVIQIKNVDGKFVNSIDENGSGFV